MSSALLELHQTIVEELERVKEQKILVVVEGKKDQHALAAVGITHTLRLDKPLFAMVEKIAETTKEIVLLVDLDNEGKKIYSTLSKDLMRHGIRINNNLRELLYKSPVRHIEGLATWITTVSENQK